MNLHGPDGRHEARPRLAQPLCRGRIHQPKETTMTKPAAQTLDQQLQQTLVTNLSSALPGWVVSSQPMSSDQVVLNEKNVINRGYEFAWANGGIQTIFGWIKSAQNVTVRLDPSLSVLQFGLNTEADSGKHPHRIPLGWYLSDTSRHLLELQLTDSLKRAKSVDNSLKSFKQYFYSR